MSEMRKFIDVLNESAEKPEKLNEGFFFTGLSLIMAAKALKTIGTRLGRRAMGTKTYDSHERGYGNVLEKRQIEITPSSAWLELRLLSSGGGDSTMDHLFKVSYDRIEAMISTNVSKDTAPSKLSISKFTNVATVAHSDGEDNVVFFVSPAAPGAVFLFFVYEYGITSGVFHTWRERRYGKACFKLPGTFWEYVDKKAGTSISAVVANPHAVGSTFADPGVELGEPGKEADYGDEPWRNPLAPK